MPNRHDAQGETVNSNSRRMIQASVVADARSVHAPGVVLVEDGRVLASGAPEVVGTPGPDVVVDSHPGHLVAPPMVNAHVHLDLSDLPPLPDGGDFDGWLGAIIGHRRAQQAPGAVEAAVEQGVAASLRGGCPFVGDVCGSIRAYRALAASVLGGVGFVEVLGHGSRVDAARALVEAITELPPSRHGLVPGCSPHAPYSTAPGLYAAARDAGLPVSTHLAESQEELAWCRDGGGPFGTRLAAMGYAPDEAPPPGVHPLEAYLPRLEPSPRTVVAHANYCDPRHLEALAEHGATVVYCPRAYRYFGHPQGGATGHPWAAMLRAGVPVALGTDGRPCLPASGPAANRLSVVDEVLRLQEEGATLEQWLPMATVHGAAALGVPLEQVLLEPGVTTGLIALPIESPDPVRIRPGREVLTLLGPGA